MSHAKNNLILGIGIDSVEIDRFAHWHTYSKKSLEKIFSPDEIVYCLEHNAKRAERFAIRFAAREALWKALCQAWPQHSMNFLSFCRAVAVAHGKKGVPYFIIDTLYFSQHDVSIEENQILLSLTHTKTIATAWVVICAN